jgi:nucleoside-diphosphate-sugar epimerase
VRHAPHRDCVDVVVGGLSDPDVLDRAVRDARRVYHLAALLPGARGMDLEEVNVHGTESLLRACARSEALERFIFTSSVAVYEGAFMPDEWPLAETAAMGPRGSDSLRSYGISKIEAERLVRLYAERDGFEHVILRPSTCYGPGSERVRELINRVLTDPWAGRDAGGHFPMQLIHVRDLAVAIAEAGRRAEACDDVFNVAGAEGLSFLEVARLIRRLAGRLGWGSAAMDDTWVWRRYLRPYDISKIADVLGFTPAIRMDEGFAEALADEGLLHDGDEGGEAYEGIGNGRGRPGWSARRRELADAWR